MNLLPQRPNIVLVMADDMGYGDPGCYNSESKVPTPNIDRLAREGKLFTDAHSPSALCTPSRYGLLTGRYYWRTSRPHDLVMPYEPPVIETGRMTIASMLRERGYNTACIGKWHLGFLYPKQGSEPLGYTQHESEIDFAKNLAGGPLDLGFDYFFGTAGCSTSDAPYCYIENNRTVGIPSQQSTEDLNNLPGFYPGLMVPEWRVEDVDISLVDKAKEYIRDHVENNHNEPFFLYFPLSAPHNPWVVPEFLKGSSKDGSRGDMNVLADWCLGQVYDELKNQGILDNTLLIYTSDHGPQYHVGETGHKATGSLRGQKNTAFEGGHRVPFVARWPGQILADSSSGELICHTDLLASFAELTGEALAEGFAEDGLSMLPSLLNLKNTTVRQLLVADTGHHGLSSGDFSIRHEHWKLIILAPRHKAGSKEYLLFNLENDPYEENDVKAIFPELVIALEELLAKVKTRSSSSQELNTLPLNR